MNNDWKKDLKPQGGQYSGGPNRGSKGGGFGHKGSQGGAPPQFPADYLKDGYFDVVEGKEYIKSELLTDQAAKVAKSFGSKMTNSQLRRFYGHVKTAEKAYMFTKDDRKLVNDIKALDSFVAEAKGKDKVPNNFYTFVNKNVNEVKSQHDVLKGFLPHFQSVVAYYSYYYPQNK